MRLAILHTISVKYFKFCFFWFPVSNFIGSLNDVEQTLEKIFFSSIVFPIVSFVQLTRSNVESLTVFLSSVICIISNKIVSNYWVSHSPYMGYFLGILEFVLIGLGSTGLSRGTIYCSFFVFLYAGKLKHWLFYKAFKFLENKRWVLEFDSSFASEWILLWYNYGSLLQ